MHSPGHLTLEAFREWRAFERFLDYLADARGLAPGTLGEYANAAVWVAKYHVHPDVAESRKRDLSLVRRYMDWRNEWQARAERARRAVDTDELAEQGRWADWPTYQAAVRKATQAWDRAGGAQQAVTRASAKQLHGEHGVKGGGRRRRRETPSVRLSPSYSARPAAGDAVHVCSLSRFGAALVGSMAPRRCCAPDAQGRAPRPAQRAGAWRSGRLVDHDAGQGEQG